MKNVVATIASILIASAALAKDPCASELCLSDYKAAKQGGMCKGPIDDFFSVKCKKNGDFSPGCTLKARRSYLNKCESGNEKEKKLILATFGKLPSKP